MAEAEQQITISFRGWVKLSDYADQKTDETGDREVAHGLIALELEREAEGRLPYRYKRADDIDGRWHMEGLPIGYYWRDHDPQINYASSTASWPARLRPGLGWLPELKIYQIQVLPPVVATAEPEPTAEPAESQDEETTGPAAETLSATALSWTPAAADGAGESNTNDAASKTYPGDSPAEASVRASLTKIMRDDPENKARRSKQDLKDRCLEDPGISGRAFERIWANCITDTGAVAYKTGGPRGPHTAPRRSK
jgi:hypothetical protein